MHWKQKKLFPSSVSIVNKHSCCYVTGSDKITVSPISPYASTCCIFTDILLFSPAVTLDLCFNGWLIDWLVDQLIDWLIENFSSNRLCWLQISVALPLQYIFKFSCNIIRNSHVVRSSHKVSHGNNFLFFPSSAWFSFSLLRAYHSRFMNMHINLEQF